MPYVKSEDRNDLLPNSYRTARTAGELNFQITDLAITYINRNGLSYQAINDVLGALEGAKAEFYRRVAAPYEDPKIVENGDVYPYILYPPTSAETKPASWQRPASPCWPSRVSSCR